MASLAGWPGSANCELLYACSYGGGQDISSGLGRSLLWFAPAFDSWLSGLLVLLEVRMEPVVFFLQLLWVELLDLRQLDVATRTLTDNC